MHQTHTQIKSSHIQRHICSRCVSLGNALKRRTSYIYIDVSQLPFMPFVLDQITFFVFFCSFSVRQRALRRIWKKIDEFSAQPNEERRKCKKEQT